MKKFWLDLAPTPAFAFSGITGFLGCLQFLCNYRIETDKSHGMAYWIGFGGVLLFTGYIVLFIYVRFILKHKPAAAQEKDTNHES